jgi:methylated-DNA-[protein]-cysteine S-methyltransferase
MPASRPAEQTYYTLLDTPFGALCIAATAQGLTHVEFQDGERPLRREADWQEDRGVLDAAREQLRAYFEGRRQRFTLPVAPGGTPFQQRVWRELQAIPWGTTTTYREIAEQLGQPAAVRAVGHANGRNPVAIVIPCHRVVGANGRLTGYAGGIAVKRRLLQHEGALLV